MPTTLVKTYSEEEIIEIMEERGYQDLWADVAQLYRFCVICEKYVSVDDISEDVCDNCC